MKSSLALFNISFKETVELIDGQISKRRVLREPNSKEITDFDEEIERSER
jgi:hypothetical protein